MTIASLIVDVLANTAKLEKDVAKINSTLDRVSGMASKVGKALVAGFTIGAVTKLASDFISFAGNVVDLNTKTGISTTGLQKLGIAFEQNGISMETAAGGALKMQRLLGGDDKGLQSLVGKLGLSFDGLKKMQPEEAFLTVADAIGKIPNQNEKALAATTAFGKGGVELLAGLNGTLGATIDKYAEMGLIISEETLVAADDFGDSLGLLSKLGMVLISQVLGPMLPGLMKLVEWFGYLATGAVGLAKELANGLIVTFYMARIGLLELVLQFQEASQKIPLLGKYLGATNGTIADTQARLAEAKDTLAAILNPIEKVADGAKKATGPLLGLSDASDKNGKTAAKLADELERNTEAARKVEPAFYGVTESVGVLDTSQVQAATSLKALNLTMSEVEARGVPVANSFYQIAGALDEIGRKAKMPSLDDLPWTEADWQGPKLPPMEIPISFGKSLEGAFANLPGILQSAFTGGGGVGGAIGAFGTEIGSSMFGKDGALKGITKAVAGMVPVIGPALAAALPAIGAMLGPALKGLHNLILGPFKGPSKEELAGRDLVGAFEDQIAGMLTATQKLEAGNESWKMTVIGVRDKYLATGRSAADAEAAVAKLWASSKEGAGATEAALAAINAVLDEQADLADVATTAQTDAAAVADARMAALQTGLDDLMSQRESLMQSVATEAPEAVMGVIEAATRGQIAVLDDQITEQNRKLAMSAEQAAGDLEDVLSRIQPEAIHVPVVFDVGDLPSGWSGGSNVIPMAGGGAGRVTGPTLFLAGEAGAEDFAFSGAGKRFGGQGGGSQEVHTHVYLDGREIAHNVERRLSERVQLRQKQRAA